MAGDRKRVAVAMSGGVDSSLASALLMEQGFEVVGVTMLLEGPEEKIRMAVTDAQKVARYLGFDHHIIDLRDKFHNKVVSYFVREYLAGRTPNPCVMCNQFIKFGALLEAAMALGADYLATGHYARVFYDDTLQRYLLRKAVDKTKDQSYVLFGLRQGQFARVLFPLGKLTKEKTREMAAARGLPVALKAESQEICFVPEDDYRKFLRERVSEIIKPGPIIDRKSRMVLGTHQGLPFYTIGQRRGLGLTAPRPLYVVELSAEDNAVIVGEADEVTASSLLATDVNFIPFDKLEREIKVKAKIRYKAPEADAFIEPADKGVKVTFVEPQRAITPGQAVVFYNDDLVIGGGIIQISQ